MPSQFIQERGPKLADLLLVLSALKWWQLSQPVQVPLVQRCLPAERKTAFELQWLPLLFACEWVWGDKLSCHQCQLLSCLTCFDETKPQEPAWELSANTLGLKISQVSEWQVLSMDNLCQCFDHFENHLRTSTSTSTSTSWHSMWRKN